VKEKEFAPTMAGDRGKMPLLERIGDDDGLAFRVRGR